VWRVGGQADGRNLSRFEDYILCYDTDESDIMESLRVAYDPDTQMIRWFVGRLRVRLSRLDRL